ncbi:MAG: hypothetical protein K0R10_2996 [Alphaproteobacteria bacterium]|nr:hypothetical protein [Alphaproteobacteria bacterium]
MRVPILYALLLIVPVWYFAKGRQTAEDWLAQRIPARFLLLLAAVAYYGWLFSQTIYRYLLPLDMLSPLLIVAAVGLLPLARKARVATASALLLLITLSIQPGNWGRHDGFKPALAQIEMPVLPEKPMLLMAGTDAYAYLLPQLPPDAVFVRIESRGFKPDASTGLNERIAARIAAHRGPLYLFAPKREVEMATRAAYAFRLMPTPPACREVIDSYALPDRLPLSKSGDDYPREFALCVMAKHANP